ncbi:hypothetical protein C8Q79DRAFT_171922 [Trametes meyenii]|nr:hypothetical protein C8Q79DRAFT_171922 [Trametes meyenii]
MHSCLQIQEIIYAILETLDGHEYDIRDPYPPRVVCRQQSALYTFASLARTCKTFKGPALEILWREIPDLCVLIKHLMPSELLHIDDTGVYVSFTRAPSAAEWAVLDPYVWRIRSVGIATARSGVPPYTLDENSVLRPLEAYLRSTTQPGSRVLFPNLRHVVYRPAWAWHELYSVLLLHPGLRTLELPTLAFTPESNWPPSTPPLSDMRSMLFDRLTTNVLPAVQRMHSLRNLLMGSLIMDLPTLTHLGALSSMTGLALDGSASIFDYPPRSALSVPAFTEIRHLLVTIARREAPAVIAHVSPRALEAVTIHWEDLFADPDSSGIEVLDCLTALSELPCPTGAAHPCLQHLIVALDPEMESLCIPRGPGFADPHPLRVLEGPECAEYLTPALALGDLRTLIIGIDVIFWLNHAFLKALAQALPRLEVLALAPPIQVPYEFDLLHNEFENSPEAHIAGGTPEQEDHVSASRPLTLDGLLILSEHCINLTTVRLAVKGAFTPGYYQPGIAHRGPCSTSSGVRMLELWTTVLATGVPNAA